jgi:hypothetical protein
VEKGAIRTGLDIVDTSGLEIDVERTRNMLSRACLREEGRETAIGCRGRPFDKTTIGLPENK